jgi:hypothetical protein
MPAVNNPFDLSLKRAGKRFLTSIGSRLTPTAALQLQGVVNYVRVGQWMKQHGFIAGRRVRSRQDVWETILREVRDQKVLYLEFGVYQGEATRFWSERLTNPTTVLHGFDSFEGLPEEVGPWTKADFDLGGRIPTLDDPRVTFYKGWFSDVLPHYQVPSHDVLVMNMDADIYSSTAYVLRHFRPWIKQGSYIYFDEFNHIDQEPRAFHELIESGFRFRLVSTDSTLAFSCFQCTQTAS